MKRSDFIILLFILAVLLAGCAGRAEAPAAGDEASPIQTETALAATPEPAEAETMAPAEPEPMSEPGEAKEPSLIYDAREQTESEFPG